MEYKPIFCPDCYITKSKKQLFMKKNISEKATPWLWIGVTVLVALILLWLTIFEFWSA